MSVVMPYTYMYVHIHLRCKWKRFILIGVLWKCFRFLLLIVVNHVDMFLACSVELCWQKYILRLSIK